MIAMDFSLLFSEWTAFAFDHERLVAKLLLSRIVAAINRLFFVIENWTPNRGQSHRQAEMIQARAQGAQF